jgi:Fic family protein
VLLDATRNHEESLSDERLFGWHAALFPTGWSGLGRITVGDWRNDAKGPMEVVSGRIGKERVHFQAPSQERLKNEMDTFIAWFNAEAGLDPVIKSALVHFYFLTIHPFDDGNGRIARALADLQLARADRTAFRFYSMSTQIQQEKKAYYHMLESCQKGSLDISNWVEWYLHCLQRAIAASQHMLDPVLEKAAFWKQHAGASFHARQRVMLNRLLDGFQGKLSSSKWAELNGCSQDTAQRDIQDLIRRGILEKEAAGGRSTSCRLCER